MAEVKFCGLTRPEDAAFAASLGAAFVGAVFAPGPRTRTAAEARVLFDAAAGAGSLRCVGVFGSQSPTEIIAIADAARLDVVQLHGASDPDTVDEIRQHFAGEVWRVLRVRVAPREAELRAAPVGVDAVVVDALVDGALGGTGVAVDWDALAAAIERAGRPARLILAGGLRAENVGRAVELVAPDVVDVSSGVESAPGIKDHERMRAFALAAARGGR